MENENFTAAATDNKETYKLSKEVKNANNALYNNSHIDYYL